MYGVLSLSKIMDRMHYIQNSSNIANILAIARGMVFKFSVELFNMMIICN